MLFRLPRLFRPAALGLVVGVASLAGSQPAQAMCGGNIFMTCPPVAKKQAPVVETRAKPRKRRAPPRTASR